jgi:hypothetical protein
LLSFCFTGSPTNTENDANYDEQVDGVERNEEYLKFDAKTQRSLGEKKVFTGEKIDAHEHA